MFDSDDTPLKPRKSSKPRKNAANKPLQRIERAGYRTESRRRSSSPIDSLSALIAEAERNSGKSAREKAEMAETRDWNRRRGRS